VKHHPVVNLSVLMIGLALSSPSVLAQASPAPELPSRPTSISSYRPPSEAERLRRYEFDAFGPFAFANAALGAGFQQATNSPPEWGGGVDAFGARVASNFGIQLVTATTRFGMAQAFREDTLYYRCDCIGFFPRLGHALISTVTARRGYEGHVAFSFSQSVSPYAGTMTALAWYPDRYGVKDGFRMGNYNLAAQAAGNLIREFIYGGPHTLVSHLRHSNAPDLTAANQNP
jgi:hypothetical protein